MTDQNQDYTSAKMRKAYGAAMTRLREAHRDEFNAFQKEEAKSLGIEWSPRPTDAEKAKAQLEELLAKHPELREQMTPAPTPEFDGDTPGNTATTA